MKRTKKAIAKPDQAPPIDLLLNGDRRLSESVYNTLLKMILSGQLAPGQPMSELELTRLLNVSRTPVHEAVGQLIKDGLVIQPANRRPVVSKFSADEIYDVYELRRILEGEAAFKAAPRIDRHSLSKLRARAEEYRDQVGKPDAIEQWALLDDEFHATIAAASGSRRLESDILRYRRLHQVFNRIHADITVCTYGLQEHMSILDALENRDAERSRKHMQEHITEWQRYFVRLVTESGTSN